MTAPARGVQRVALGLLLVAAVFYVVSIRWASYLPAPGYLRAFCEAALVGGLADWFAVTALFRHPLGLPVPHTAIIPASKDRIGVALGRFVENNFLTQEVVGRRIAEVDFAGVLARWLRARDKVEPVANWLARMLPASLDALGADPARRFLRDYVTAGLRSVDAGAALATLLETLTSTGQHEPLVDELLNRARDALGEIEPALHDRVSKRLGWLWRRVGLDARITERLLEAARELLTEIINDPQHPLRQRCTQALRGYAEALRHDPVRRTQLEHLKEILLGHPVYTRYLHGLWSELSARIREDVAAPESVLRAGLLHSLQSFGHALETDEEMMSLLNERLRTGLQELALGRRHEVSRLIATTVAQWDAQTLSDKLEQTVGPDLQYVRINGTLIGGLVGVLLHFVSQWL